MATEHPASFAGFPDFRSNVTYTPIQVFTVLLPNASRGCVRLVLYMIRRILGWVDKDGNPVETQLEFTFNELQTHAGVGRDAIAPALAEAVEKRYINCLRMPQKKKKGIGGQSGMYELNWDDSKFSNNPAEFNGFFFHPSYINAQGIPKLSRKNIPNVFFDYLVKREKLSVIRVVGALLFYSIAWGAGGERKKTVQKSIRELARLTNMERVSISRALAEAVEKGYIERAERGYFDLSANNESKVTVYGIRWNRKPQENHSQPSTAYKAEDGQSENVARPQILNSRKTLSGSYASVGKCSPEQSTSVARDSRKMLSGKQSEKVPHKEIKLEKVPTAAAIIHPSKDVSVAAVNEQGMSIELLRNQGFTERDARRLAQLRSLDVIKAQIEALPSRNPTRNPTGLLRKAIEEDWPITAKLQTSVVSTAQAFCEGFYAFMGGHAAQAIAEPTASDLRAAQKLLDRLSNVSPATSTQAEKLGREFGHHCSRQSHHHAPKTCAAQLRVMGDMFFTSVCQRLQPRQKASIQKRKSHDQKSKLNERYLHYLREQEIDFRRREPRQYEQFLQDRKQQFEANSLMNSLPSMRTHFDSDAWRLKDFQRFLANQEGSSTMNFDNWKQSHNKQEMS